jgi:hypothetical protein
VNPDPDPGRQKRKIRKENVKKFQVLEALDKASRVA